jgi:gliding motility-associated lipoprotein GldD
MMRVVWVLSVGLALWFVSCGKDTQPRPRGFFRIDFPEKSYTRFSSDCSFSMEIPQYGKIRKVSQTNRDNCWYNLVIPAYKATIHLTYKDIHKDLSFFSEDIRNLAYKHIVKADDIEEFVVSRPADRVYGIIYKISGNTASNISFYVTDSTSHFLSGSLYFLAEPNKDSLAPAIKFFSQDVVHLTETLVWK